MDEEKCAQCGAPAAPDAKYCESCGAPLGAQGTQSPAVSRVYQAPAYYTGVATPYQGVAIRFVAVLIDYFIIGITAGILTIPFLVAAFAIDTGTGNMSSISVGFIATAAVIGVITWFLYFTLLEGHYGQTIGKMALNIKVVKEADGLPIDYGEAAVRTILRIIDGLFDYLIGAIFIWTSDEKQRLGDRVAHTVVVSK